MARSGKAPVPSKCRGVFSWALTHQGLEMTLMPSTAQNQFNMFRQQEGFRKPYARHKACRRRRGTTCRSCSACGLETRLFECLVRLGVWNKQQNFPNQMNPVPLTAVCSIGACDLRLCFLVWALQTAMASSSMPSRQPLGSSEVLEMALRTTCRTRATRAGVW